jgi:hypothetical protein
LNEETSKIFIVDVTGKPIEVTTEEINHKTNKPVVLEYINENNINRWREKGADNE